MKRVLICCSAMSVVASCSTLTAYAAKADLTPKAENKFVMKLTGLALEPSASNLNYAVYTTPLPLTTPNWEQLVVKPDHAPAWVLSVQYQLSDNNYTRLEGMWVSTSDSSSLSTSAANTSVAPPSVLVIL